MESSSPEPHAISISPELWAETRKAAEEERRPAAELVSEAVRRYLQQRKPQQATPRKSLAQLLMESPLAGADLDLKRRKDYLPPIEP